MAEIVLTDVRSGCYLSAAYAIGGVYPGGQPKTGDAAEIGAFRNNCESARSSFRAHYLSAGTISKLTWVSV